MNDLEVFKEEEKQVIPIHEGEGRKKLSIDQSPVGFHDDQEDEIKDLKDKEEEVLKRNGKESIKSKGAAWVEGAPNLPGAFYPQDGETEKIVDPDTEDIENKLAESIDDPDAWMDEMSDKEWEIYMNHGSEEESLDYIRSRAPSPLPQEVQDILKENRLPRKLWDSMTDDQKRAWKKKIQEDIQNLYLKKPVNMVHRKKKEKTENL
ncbi:MAG: hypothetical protein AAB631_00385 [Patescibacteria group bacterium]